MLVSGCYKFDNKASLEQTSQSSQKMWKNARRDGNICLGCGKWGKLMHDILIDINIQKKIGIKKCTQLKNVENFQGAIFWVSNSQSEVLPTIIISFDITSLTWNRLIFWPNLCRVDIWWRHLNTFDSMASQTCLVSPWVSWLIGVSPNDKALARQKRYLYQLETYLKKVLLYVGIKATPCDSCTTTIMSWFAKVFVSYYWKKTATLNLMLKGRWCSSESSAT